MTGHCAQSWVAVVVRSSQILSVSGDVCWQIEKVLRKGRRREECPQGFSTRGNGKIELLLAEMGKKPLGVVGKGKSQEFGF